jgi:hypothetical protein
MQQYPAYHHHQQQQQQQQQDDSINNNNTIQSQATAETLDRLKQHLIYNLSFDPDLDPKLQATLAKQIRRYSWEVEQIQRAAPQLHLAFHPIRTAWLWMEEYGAQLWSESEHKRMHLHPHHRNPAGAFVFLRDACWAEVEFDDVDDDDDEEQVDYGDYYHDFRPEIDENLAAFCYLSDSGLHPYNWMFKKVLWLFAGVYEGLWDGGDDDDDDEFAVAGHHRTAAQLMAEFLGEKAWRPQRGFLPLYYEDEDLGTASECSSDSDDSCGEEDEGEDEDDNDEKNECEDDDKDECEDDDMDECEDDDMDECEDDDMDECEDDDMNECEDSGMVIEVQPNTEK